MAQVDGKKTKQNMTLDTLNHWLINVQKFELFLWKKWSHIRLRNILNMFDFCDIYVKSFFKFTLHLRKGAEKMFWEGEAL